MQWCQPARPATHSGRGFDNDFSVKTSDSIIPSEEFFNDPFAKFRDLLIRNDS